MASDNSERNPQQKSKLPDGTSPDRLSEKTPETTEPPAPTGSQMLMNVLTWVLVVSSLMYLWTNVTNQPYHSIPYSDFKQELINDNIKQILVKESEISGSFRVGITAGENTTAIHQRFQTVVPSFGDTELLALLESNQVEIQSIAASTPLWISIVLSVAPWLVLIAFFVYSSKMVRKSITGGGSGGDAFGFSKSRAKHFEASNISARYSDVAGLESAKQDLLEIIGFLQDPAHYRELGAKMPKGILMMGPPGCGKTLLARATAGEAGVPFFSVSGSEFIEMFVGVGASRVRDMFNNARKQAPALIFIDEIDSVGRIRGTGLGGGNDEREQTLNQILAEMDGFSPDEAVVVLAATNRPDVLDPALLRPGRFDRKLVLELPGRNARKDILAVHTRKVPLADDVDSELIAAETVGFSGADLANLVNEAALRAARSDAKVVCMEDFSEAREKIVMGATQGEILSDKERERVAYHEAGHTLTAFFSPNADPINKVSIIRHGRSLGMTEQLPKEDRHNYTQNYLEEKIAIMLGGRVAEKLHFGEVSSGAADDLKNATGLARQMVTQWGMNERIGAVNLQQSEEHPFLGREIAEPKKYSEYSAQMIDEEVNKMMSNCEKKCTQRLQQYSTSLTLLAESLLEHESLDGAEVKALLGNVNSE
ncbi:MAG: ATP-dependent zinc metalloprotease FtsH [Oceanicoccus sp.]